jgi:hypothetical protein
MPLLTKAAETGEDAKVMTVLGPGSPFGIEADLNNLGMKNSWVGAMRICPTYNDLMFEVRLSPRPTRRFINIFLSEICRT